MTHKPDAPSLHLEQSSSYHESDTYGLLHYYISKLETRTTLPEVFRFLLEFLAGIAGNHREPVPSGIFLADQETLDFKLSLVIPEELDRGILEAELLSQVEKGIVAWCITNRRVAYAETQQSSPAQRCLLVPLSTLERTLGIAILYVNIAEEDLSREVVQILSLAAAQSSLYAENMAMFQELQSAHSRLVHSEKLSSIGQLAAGVAHEINNPVGYVLGNMEVLAGYVTAMKKMLDIYKKNISMPELENEANELDIPYILGDIDTLISANLEGLKRVTEIVANLKDFAHLNGSSARAWIDLEENLQKALMIANNEIKYVASVTMKFGKISRVKCNAGEINQVFLNILINAAQAIGEQKREKQGLINLQTRQDERWVYVDIADDGPGIPAPVLSKIFDPFFTTKPVGKGTGLGLNIAWDIVVNKHGGEISVQSKVGSGTCFTIKLPRVEPEET